MLVHAIIADMSQEQFPQPPDNPEQLRSDAVRAHAAGNLALASEIRSRALKQMAPDDPNFPGVEATLAFSMRTKPTSLAEFGQLRAVAMRAANTTNDRLKARGDKGCDHDTLAEQLPATLMHYGVIVGGLAVRAELNNEPNAEKHLAEFGKAISVADDLSRNMPLSWGFIHQTRVNLARRNAAMLGITGKPVRGLLASVGAVLKAPLSESPRLTANANDQLSLSERVKAITKAAVGGVAAAAVCAANLPGIRTMGGRDASLKLFAASEGMSWLIDAPAEPSAQPNETQQLPQSPQQDPED